MEVGKLELTDESEIVKLEPFEEEIFDSVVASSAADQFGGTQSGAESMSVTSQAAISSVDFNAVSDSNVTDNNEYADNMLKSLGNKKIRKHKNKSPHAAFKVDMKAKLERSRQSARECRARKKLRYQYLEDLVIKREHANVTLKDEIEQLKEVANMFASGCSKSEIEKKLHSI